MAARLNYPHPEDLEEKPLNVQPSGLPRVFWIYLAGAVLVGAGFADFLLIAYHFARTNLVTQSLIPVFYAVAMGVSGIGSLLLGRLFDRMGLLVLVPQPRDYAHWPVSPKLILRGPMTDKQRKRTCDGSPCPKPQGFTARFANFQPC